MRVFLHLLPKRGSDIFPCCGKNKWATPLCERVTAVKQNVTCKGDA